MRPWTSLSDSGSYEQHEVIRRRGFEDTLRSFWATRPVRPRRGGKLGGVSAAIGTRYGIDPILVRVAFVLATIYGGAGVVLYLLGWLVFPKEGDLLPGSTEPTREPTSTGLAVVLVLLLIPACSG